MGKKVSRKQEKAIERANDFMSDPRIKNLNLFQRQLVFEFSKKMSEIRIREERERIQESVILAFEQAIVVTTLAYCQVMRDKYWIKSSREKLPKMIDEMSNLMESYMCDAVSFLEMADYIEMYTGKKLHCDWMKEESTSIKDLMYFTDDPDWTPPRYYEKNGERISS